MINRVRKMGYPLIIVDANSTDGTIEKAESMGVEVIQRGDLGMGYGCGVRKAFMVAADRGYEYLGLLDCDITYAPEDFELLLPFIPENDMVVGARQMNDIILWRRLGNYAHTFAAMFLYFRNIMDVNSGMRLMRVNKFLGHIDAYHFGMIPQISSLAMRNRYSYKEVPISYSDRAGESKVNIMDGWYILWALIKERFKKRIKQ